MTRLRPRVTAIAAVLLVGLAGSLAGCTSNGGSAPTSTRPAAIGELRIPGDASPAGFGQDQAPVAQPYTVLTFNVCAVGGPVRINAVRLNLPRGLKLRDWGWRPYMSGLQGGQPGLATRLDQGFTHRPIDIPCSTHQPGAAIVISVARTSKGAGTEHSFTIAYPGGSLRVPFGIALCPDKCTEAELKQANF